MPSVDFGVLRHGERIDLQQADSGVHTGISYDTQMRGVVPFFEEYDAMVAANYNRIEWKKLRPADRAEAVAHFRLNKHIAVHTHDALETDIRRKRKK